MSDFNIRDLDELWTMKKIDPKKYKEQLKGMKEVSIDLMKMLKEVMRESG